MGKVSSKSIVVQKTFDLFDGTLAHTIQMSHASNIENPQSLLFGSRGGITENAMSWSSRNREINLGNKITASGMSLSIAVDGNGGSSTSNDVGGVAELVAKDEISSNAGYTRLGGSAQAMNIRVQHRRGQMKTAVVENNAGKALPCASNPELDYDETEHFVSGAFSGDVRCALALGETDSGTPGNKRRRHLRHDSERKLVQDHFEPENTERNSQNDKVLSNYFKFPGEDTWAGRSTITAEHPLIMPTDHLHGLSVAVPMLKKSYKYAEVVNGVVQKDVELEINRELTKATAGLV